MDSATRKEAVEKILVSVPDYMQKIKCDTNSGTPPFKCAVSYCPNFFLNYAERDKYPCKFHDFPGDMNLCNIWKENCRLPQNANISELKVCSDHFSLDDYIRNYREEFQNPNFKRTLKPDAIPQRNLYTTINPCPDTSNEDLLSSAEIKEAVDENKSLRNKYRDLLKRKSELMKKVGIHKKRNTHKLKELQKLRGIWENDLCDMPDVKNKKNVVRTVFSDAQINLLLGKKKVYWSDDDLAKAFVLRHMGGKECYLYLKNKLNIPLPALSCIQKWAASCSS